MQKSPSKFLKLLEKHSNPGEISNQNNVTQFLGNLDIGNKIEKRLRKLVSRGNGKRLYRRKH